MQVKAGMNVLVCVLFTVYLSSRADLRVVHCVSLFPCRCACCSLCVFVPLRVKADMNVLM